MKKLLSCLFLVCIAISTWKCKKDPPLPVPPTTLPAPVTSIRVSFANVVGAVPLTLGPPYQYVNLNGDSFCVNTYKYYISNISFTDADNNTWSEPESYHLINAANPGSLTFTINSIPAATYTSMRFMIGVDSARNCSGAQTGPLDPVNNMFWTWSTGYIMGKFEGQSPASPAAANSLSFHVAGYEGQYAAQRWVTLPFASDPANVSASISPVVHINCDVLEWFQSPRTMDFSTVHSLGFVGVLSEQFADNYADMFTFTGVDN
jgi:hypothetical protein